MRSAVHRRPGCMMRPLLAEGSALPWPLFDKVIATICGYPSHTLNPVCMIGSAASCV